MSLGFATKRDWVGATMAVLYLLGVILVGRIFFEMWHLIVYATSIPIASTILATMFATCRTLKVSQLDPQLDSVSGHSGQSLALIGATALAFGFPCLSLMLPLIGLGNSPFDAPIELLRHTIGIAWFIAILWIALVLSTGFMCGVPFALRRFRLGLLMITTSLVAINLNLLLAFMIWAVTRPGF